MMPDRVELAMLLGVDDAPAVAEYRRELSSVLHGQASHGIRGRQLRPAELVAAERVEHSRRERARTNRLGRDCAGCPGDAVLGAARAKAI
jgi:hypothetical protein